MDWIGLLTTAIEGLPGCCQALLSSFPLEMAERGLEYAAISSFPPFSIFKLHELVLTWNGSLDVIPLALRL